MNIKRTIVAFFIGGIVLSALLFLIFRDEIRTFYFVRTVVNSQHLRSYPFLLGNQLSFEEEDHMMEIIRNEAMQEKLISYIKNLSWGTVEERKAAGVLATSLASRMPNQATINLMDYYLSLDRLSAAEGKTHDYNVASEMLIELKEKVPSKILDPAKKSARQASLIQAQKSWFLNSESTSATLAEAMKSLEP